MPIPTSRTKEAASVTIQHKLCTGCGQCAKVCKDFSIVIENHKARLSDTPLFGCVGCGHCMAVCPNGAIQVTGRALSSADLFDLPSRKSAADYEELQTLMQRRRSIREFKNKPVEANLIQKILDAAVSAPMGLPPSDVNVLVLDSKEKNRAFAKDFCEYLEGMRWFVSDWFLFIMRPFWGKANDESFRGFVKPAFNIFTKNMQEGYNLVTYDAPLMMYFYGSPYTDPADPIVAATYAMLAGEALGLGTCMLGSVHPFIQSGKKAARFRKDHGILYPSREGVIVIFGYPDVKYQKSIRRTFASVTIQEN